jgi:flagellar hook-associated protein 2
MGDFGALSSLGLGSGVLNYNVIDKLKQADEDAMVKPLQDKLDLYQKREKAITQFINIGNTLQSDVQDIADGTLFAKVNTSVNGTSVTVDASDGVSPQKFTIDVTQLAKNDVYESKGFAAEDSVINTSGNSVTLDIGVGDTTTSITLQAGATLEDLENAINNANAGVTASIINTGIGDDPYKLVLKANDTGKDNIIKFNYSGIEDLGLNAINYTSATYTSDTDSVNNSGSDQTFSITVNGTQYSMTVTNGETVSDFITALNNGDLKDSNGNSLSVNAQFTNGHIVFNMQAIGDITINDTNLTTDFNDNTDFTNSNRLQTAQDAEFTYNGVQIERSTNKIDDLISGVTINLQDTGLSTVDISTDVDGIVKSIKKFVADYNAMMSNLQNLVAYDQDKGTVGLFQGNSDFTMLEDMFSNDLFSVSETTTQTAFDRNGTSYDQNIVLMATDFGFSIDKNGVLSFDESKFRDMYQQHPDETKNFFETAFTKINTDLTKTITGDSSNLSLDEQNIKNEEKSYQERIKSMQEFLDTKYDIMAKQFAAYDEMINNFNAMSQSLNMTIQEAINSK